MENLPEIIAFEILEDRRINAIFASEEANICHKSIILAIKKNCITDELRDQTSG